MSEAGAQPVSGNGTATATATAIRFRIPSHGAGSKAKKNGSVSHTAFASSSFEYKDEDDDQSVVGKRAAAGGEYRHTQAKDEPLVIPVAANKLRSQLPPATTNQESSNNNDHPHQENGKKEGPTSTEGGDDDVRGDNAAHHREALEALQSEASRRNGGGGRGSDDDDDKEPVVVASTGVDPSRIGSVVEEHNKETEQLRRDVNELPDAPSLEEYRASAVPISQFGAAMLRGMGWNGHDNQDERDGNSFQRKDPGDALPRPHRLGLGAIPRAAAASDDVIGGAAGVKGGGRDSRMPRRPDQVRQEERLKRQLAEFASQRKERATKDPQALLQDGSIVYLLALPDDNGDRSSRLFPRRRRARVLQLMGVPGLNKVKVQLEYLAKNDSDGDEDNRLEAIVNRRDLGDLVSRTELAERPFRKAPRGSPKANDDGEPSEAGARERGDRRTDDGERRQGSKRRDRSDEDDVVVDDDEYGSKKRHRRDRDRSSDDNDNSRRRRERYRLSDSDSDSYGASSKRNREERKNRKKDRPPGERARSEDGTRKGSQGGAGGVRQESHDSWLMPHIRVRVATAKLGRQHLQQKGVVVDVTPKGATLRMDGGGSSSKAAETTTVLLDRVPARYLTTALPKAHGFAVVVQGRHKYAKGTVLQRDSRQAVIQLDEDHSVLTLPLDDLAEWCGPRDDVY